MLTSCSRFLQQRNVGNWGVLTFHPLTAFNPTKSSTSLHFSTVLGGQELKPWLSLWAEESESRGLGSSSLHPSPAQLLRAFCYCSLTWSRWVSTHNTVSAQLFPGNCSCLLHSFQVCYPLKLPCLLFPISLWSCSSVCDWHTQPNK